MKSQRREDELSPSLPDAPSGPGWPSFHGSSGVPFNLRRPGRPSNPGLPGRPWYLASLSSKDRVRPSSPGLPGGSGWPSISGSPGRVSNSGLPSGPTKPLSYLSFLSSLSSLSPLSSLSFLYSRWNIAVGPFLHFDILRLLSRGESETRVTDHQGNFRRCCSILYLKETNDRVLPAPLQGQLHRTPV